MKDTPKWTDWKENQPHDEKSAGLCMFLGVSQGVNQIDQVAESLVFRSGFNIYNPHINF